MLDHDEPTAWRFADFIVGKLPFIGNKRIREALGSDYVDRLRAVYPGLPRSVDLVMFWCIARHSAWRTVRADA